MPAMFAPMCSSLLIACTFICLEVLAPAQAQTLKLERKISLGDVAGRIDHMAFDPATGRLFVAELGNNSVGIVDVNTGALVHRITGLDEPQGVAYAPKPNLLIVANGGTGEVAAYNAADYATAWKINFGRDADNVRVDAATGELFVGYASALASLDDDGANIRSAQLAGHPEAFRLAGERVFVNVPSARQIAVVDRRSGRVHTWPMQSAKGNFPMAINTETNQVFTVFREPPRLAAFDMDSGKVMASVEICGDADDVWDDQKRRRVYVSCGDGHVAVLNRDGGALREIERVRTIEGARTSLFVPDLDLLFLAARARGTEKAAIWVFRARD
jgi:YVTN family beta-propeller protein